MKQLIANTNSSATENGTECYFAYSGLDVIAELDAGKDITEFYIRGLGLGGGIGDIIAEVRTDSTNYYTYNYRGDVVLITDFSSDTTATYEYTAFGEPILNTYTLYDRFIGFSSKEYDVKSGLSYYGFRYYDSQSARWMKKDPKPGSLIEKNRLNLYQICYSDCINYIDLYGLNSFIIWCEIDNVGDWDGNAPHNDWNDNQYLEIIDCVCPDGSKETSRRLIEPSDDVWWGDSHGGPGNWGHHSFIITNSAIIGHPASQTRVDRYTIPTRVSLVNRDKTLKESYTLRITCECVY